MVRINLLPVREIRRRFKARQELIILAVCFAFFLGILAFFALQQSGQSDDLQTELTGIQARIAQHQQTLDRMKQLDKDREILEIQIGIIDKLKAEASLTVRVLDEVARIIPNQRMWLNSLAQQGTSLQLSGMALDNRTIAMFMEELEQSPFIKTVTLANASLQVYAGRDLKSFSLSCVVGMPDKESAIKQK